MRDGGSALRGIGTACGDGRAAAAATAAVSSPLVETTLDGATGVLLNITGPLDLGLFEVNEAAEVVTGHADPNANVIFGAVIDENMRDEVQVTVIATGFGARPRRRRLEATVPSGTGPRSETVRAPGTGARAGAAAGGRDRPPDLPEGGGGGGGGPRLAFRRRDPPRAE